MREFTILRSSLIGFGLILLTLVAVGQSNTITGRVTDEQSGEPLPGATILEKSTTNGVATDMDGINPTGLKR